MHWGVFVGLSTVANIFIGLVFLAIILIVLWVVISTPVGLVVLAGLIIWLAYKVGKFFKEN